MSGSVGNLAVTLSLDAALFSAGLDKGNKDLKAFSSAASAGFAVIGAAESGLGAIGGGFGAAFNWVKTGIDDLANLGRESQKLGLSVEALSGLQFAAGRSGEAMDSALRHLSRHLGEAAAGGKEARDKFAAFNLDGKELAGLGLEGAVFKIADSMRDVRDPGVRSAMAMELMGREAADMIPFLSKGAEGLKQLEANGKKLGAIVSGEDVARAMQAERAMDDLGASFKGVQRDVAAGVAPFITGLANATGDWLKTFDIKAAIKGGFDWLMGEAPVVIEFFAAVAKEINSLERSIVVMGEKAGVVFQAIANPVQFVNMKAKFARIDYDAALFGDMQDKGVNDIAFKLKMQLFDAMEKAKAGALDLAGKQGPAAGADNGFVIKQAMELPANGLNIFDQYASKMAHIDAVTDAAGKKTEHYKNAVADLGLELSKSIGTKHSEAISDAASSYDKLIAKVSELKGLGLDDNTLAIESAKAFDQFGGGKQAYHPVGAAMQGSHEAYSAIAKFQDQTRGSDPQERLVKLAEESKRYYAEMAKSGKIIADWIEAAKVKN